VMMDGKIVRTGGIELAEALEEKGYEWIEQELFHDTDVASAEAAAQDAAGSGTAGGKTAQA